MSRHFHTYRCLYYTKGGILACKQNDGPPLPSRRLHIERIKIPKGPALFVAWLTPGMPPPGPFG